jgi:hypothetical protein
MLELMAAMTIFAVGVMAFLANFFGNARAIEVTRDRDDARIAIENAAEMLRGADFASIYSTYHGTTVEVPSLEAPEGGPAQVTITCFVDETTLPGEFGPVLDLDGAGGLSTTDCSTTYKLLPVRLSLTFLSQDVPRGEAFYLLMTDRS